MKTPNESGHAKGSAPVAHSAMRKQKPKQSQGPSTFSCGDGTRARTGGERRAAPVTRADSAWERRHAVILTREHLPPPPAAVTP
ncbi:unnamed protein product [Lampetra planeri]